LQRLPYLCPPSPLLVVYLLWQPVARLCRPSTTTRLFSPLSHESRTTCPSPYNGPSTLPAVRISSFFSASLLYSASAARLLKLDRATRAFIQGQTNICSFEFSHGRPAILSFHPSVEATLPALPSWKGRHFGEDGSAYVIHAASATSASATL